MAEECPNVGIPRVTALMVDPNDHQHIWASVDVDVVRHNTDGGDTWEVVTRGVTDPDIHYLAITAGPPKTLLTIVPREIFASTDVSDSWCKFARDFGEAHALAWVPNYIPHGIK
jgi:hypothetical protein